MSEFALVHTTHDSDKWNAIKVRARTQGGAAYMLRLVIDSLADTWSFSVYTRENYTSYTRERTGKKWSELEVYHG